MNKIDDVFGNWLAGLVDGEGCFQIEKRGRNNASANYKCRFHLVLRDDDKAIIEEICNILEVGTICISPARPSNGRNNRAVTRFYIGAINECTQMVKLFEKYPLRTKKKRDFTIWKQVVEELQKPVDKRNPDLLEYYYLKIKEVRQYETQEELEIQASKNCKSRLSSNTAEP